MRPRTLGLALIAAITMLAWPAAEAQAACTAPAKATAYDNTADADGAPIVGYDPALASYQWLAQSFTLSSPTTLTKVSLDLQTSPSQTQDIVVEIRSDSAGNPGAILATRKALFKNSTAALEDVDFSSDRLALAAGTPYYIVAHSLGTYNWWGDASSPTYSGGNAFFSSNGTSWTSSSTFDFLFQVFSQTCTADTVPPGGANPTPIVAALSQLGLSNDAFAAESSGPPATNARKKRKLPLGTRVSYTVNEPASVRFTVRRKAKGRKVKKGKKTRCAKPTRKNRRKRKCTRLVTLKGSFTRNGVAGKNGFHFTGRLNGRKLRPGRYQLVATPSAGGKAGKPVSTGFRIVR